MPDLEIPYNSLLQRKRDLAKKGEVLTSEVSRKKSEISFLSKQIDQIFSNASAETGAEIRTVTELAQAAKAASEECEKALTDYTAAVARAQESMNALTSILEEE